ncbi:hypothetical protein GDO78_012854 [Eleutherodactylus coqui]|uniref:Uncharacterized protein n=1 Tax=Eleutherodactylus coqui TaxID=57060 RepID=A0A8J6F246_ELECQ|nr:hypothetical protein GDO78_012854 [Eleutherodactylus coqui]
MQYLISLYYFIFPHKVARRVCGIKSHVATLCIKLLYIQPANRNALHFSIAFGCKAELWPVALDSEARFSLVSRHTRPVVHQLQCI